MTYKKEKLLNLLVLANNYDRKYSLIKKEGTAVLLALPFISSMYNDAIDGFLYDDIPGKIDRILDGLNEIKRFYKGLKNEAEWNAEFSSKFEPFMNACNKLKESYNKFKQSENTDSAKLLSLKEFQDAVSVFQSSIPLAIANVEEVTGWVTHLVDMLHGFGVPTTASPFGAIFEAYKAITDIPSKGLTESLKSALSSEYETATTKVKNGITKLSLSLTSYQGSLEQKYPELFKQLKENSSGQLREMLLGALKATPEAKPDAATKEVPIVKIDKEAPLTSEDVVLEGEPLKIKVEVTPQETSELEGYSTVLL